MAANYWASTQRRHWQFSRESLNELRQQLEDEEKTIVQQYPLPDRRLLSILFNQRKHCIYRWCQAAPDLDSAGKTWKTLERETASPGNGPSIYSTLLQQS